MQCFRPELFRPFLMHLIFWLLSFQGLSNAVFFDPTQSKHSYIPYDVPFWCWKAIHNQNPKCFEVSTCLYTFHITATLTVCNFGMSKIVVRRNVILIESMIHMGSLKCGAQPARSGSTWYDARSKRSSKV